MYENDGGKAVATQPYIIQIYLASLEVRFSETQERLTGKDRGSALPWEASNANVITINLQTLKHTLSVRIEGVGRSGYDKDDKNEKRPVRWRTCFCDLEMDPRNADRE